MSLIRKKCEPCHIKIPPLKPVAINALKKELKLRWQVVGGKKIRHQFEFADFKKAMIFVNKVAKIAEIEGHHPDLYIFYNKVTVELWTHFIGGLHNNDFIIAAKIEALAV
jgi:4a-hydroxytetrahydrobiopterin dehydratase